MGQREKEREKGREGVGTENGRRNAETESKATSPGRPPGKRREGGGVRGVSQILGFVVFKSRNLIIFGETNTHLLTSTYLP